MISRNLRIALAISIGIHITAISAVSIVTPEGIGRVKPYTRVDFLGPILNKTVFDLMIENVSPMIQTTYKRSFGDTTAEGRLRIVVPRTEVTVQEFPRHLEDNMDTDLLDFFSGYKQVPDPLMDFAQEEELSPVKWGRWGDETVEETAERRVVYRPDPPSIMRGLYGAKNVFTLKVRVLVSTGGGVRKAEPLTTTGYPQLDIIATKYASSWIFAPAEDKVVGEEWREVEIEMKAGDQGR